MIGPLLRKYAVTLDDSTEGSLKIAFLPYKAGLNTFATSSDWTPGAADFKLSKKVDGSGWGAEASIASAPTWSNGRVVVVLSGTELTAQAVSIRIENATINSDEMLIETFGNASASYPHDYVDLVRMGMTALPANAANASGGLPVIGTGSNNFKSDSSANVTVGTNNDKTGYTASTVSDKTGYSLSSTQTFNNTGTWTGGITGNVGGNVVGSVASVTGAVGSVTGNVGGNVVGSTASVTGAVGSVTGNVGGNVTGSVGSISGVTFPTGFSTLTVAAIQSGLATSASQTTITSHLTDIKGASWASGEDLHTIFANYTAARAAKLDNLSGDAYARLGAPAGATVSADLAAIAAKTTFLSASSTNTANIGTTNIASVATSLYSMILANVFTAAALANAPTGGGGGSTVDIDVEITETEVEDS